MTSILLMGDPIPPCTLLDRQLAALAQAFAEEDGFTERLYRVRSSQRRRKGEMD